MKLKANLLLILLLLVVGGCGVLPLAPGKSSFKSSTGAVYEVKQSQNPKSETVQRYKKTADGSEEFETVIGAAQKDTAREVAAKLSSLKGVVWVGILVFLFGAASFAWPPLKVIVGSVTTSAVITASGLALIVLPSLLVGHEILILSVCAGAAVLYWFAHRHGNLRGTVEALKEKNGL